MTYQARYNFEGRGQGMPYLEPGDKVELADGKTVRINWVRIHKGETVFDTDELGIIYARELERV
ncbi:hypothetical protein [Kroppenstedtia sanguinis]|uniref:Uncharacterized protein n=1 Tax=Kroppenstedtia sanguinis TaxID=1380684 RepID=A0ABW4C5N2_9BACL